MGSCRIKVKSTRKLVAEKEKKNLEDRKENYPCKLLRKPQATQQGI